MERLPSSARGRRLLLTLLLALGASLVFAPAALADAFIPESGGSPNADEIGSLFKVTGVIAIVVFVGVEGALVYALVKFRAKKGRIAAQIHGNTRLEIGWTLGAALILVVLTVVTFVKLSAIIDPARSGANGLPLAGAGVLTASSTQVPTPPDGKQLSICVTGRQYIWRFTYGVACGETGFDKPYTYEQMTVPADTTVVLSIQSTDVAHSWWIPKLGGKFDALPGYTNYTWFKAPEAGALYLGQCAELCGRNHANMTARVRVVSPAEYRSFIAEQTTAIEQANKDAQKDRGALERQGDL